MNIDKNKIGRLFLCIGAVGLMVGILVYLATRKPGEDKTEDKQENVYIDVPQAEESPMQGSKSAAYRDHREVKGNSDIENYWSQCDETLEETDEQGSPTSGHPSTVQPQKKTATELFGDSPAPTASSSRGYTNPYRETAEEREQRHQRRHEEAMELAGQISSNQNGQSETEDYDAVQSITIPSNTSVRRSGVISSMDDWDSENSISSLDDCDEFISEDESRPIKCMFARESKIKGGQRAAIILLEDLLVDGVLVPKNTHLMAFCNISSRLEMTVANIEIKGRIIPLGYEAYDNDGNLGIYCPDVGSTGQTVKNRGTRIIGSGLTGRVGRTAGEIISTGISIIQNANGEKTVTVPAGYTFYIVKKKR